MNLNIIILYFLPTKSLIAPTVRDGLPRTNRRFYANHCEQYLLNVPQYRLNFRNDEIKSVVYPRLYRMTKFRV